MLENITVNNIPFFSRIVIRFIILNCELFMTRIQEFATGMYVKIKDVMQYRFISFSLMKRAFRKVMSKRWIFLVIFSDFIIFYRVNTSKCV